MPRTTLTAVPAERSSRPLLHIRRRIVLGALIALTVTSALSTFAWLTADKGAPVIPPQVDHGVVALAQTAVTDFLAARPSAVPAVKGVVTDFSAPLATGGDAPKPVKVDEISFAGATPALLGDGKYGARSLEQTVQEAFTVAAAGALYTVTVTMTQQGDNWLLAAAPAIEPANVPTRSGEPALDYGDLYADGGDTSLFPDPKTYTARISEWASVFAAAGRADPALYALTGDTSSNTYTGLGGWKVAAAPVVRSVVPVATPVPGFIARVSLVLAPRAANGSLLNADYDLYIESDKSQQQPPVVAWGPAGSYRTLDPYINADRQ